MIYTYIYIMKAFSQRRVYANLKGDFMVGK